MRRSRFLVVVLRYGARVKPEPPATLLAQAAGWEDLTRWERAELGRALRRLGWSYGEIRELIPVPKGTLSNWCRGIRLSAEQTAAIRERTGSAIGVPRDTQRKRRREIERIREEAAAEVPRLIQDPFWVAGTMLYWGEGDKRHRHLSMTNSDSDLLRLFITWVRHYVQPDAVFVLSMHLHEGNDEAAAKDHWRTALNLTDAQFWTTYVKPRSTRQRRNHLAHGVCRVFVRRGTDSWIRTLAWIEALRRDGWTAH